MTQGRSFSSSSSSSRDESELPCQARRRVDRRAGRGVAVRLGLVVVCLAGDLLGRASLARAYDPATTNAGLTERAVVASTLHQVLTRRLGRPLGLFEPLALELELLPVSQRRLLWGRLMALDPAGGYRPGDDGTNSAVGWTMAGAVIAKTPPERLQNMFFDPSTKMGLRDASTLDGLGHSLRAAADSGGFRALATGTDFSFEGMSSLDWLESPQNDLGLPALFEHLEQAVVAPERAQRNANLVRALLALGGVLTVLEDAGNPAQVRNDFRASYLQGAAGSPFDRGPPYDRAVADRYGVQGVPAPKRVVRRQSWKAYFTGADGQGLADRTQRRFFSAGTIPEDSLVDHDTTELDVVQAARESLTYALPGVPRLDLRQLGQIRYVTAPDGAGGEPRAVLGYERVPGRVRFFLDERVYADTARALLPEIASYAAGLVDHLFRTSIRLTIAGGRVRADILAAGRQLPVGRIVLLAEDARGHRQAIGAFATRPGTVVDLSAPVPAGARRGPPDLAGDDAAGAAMAFAELSLASAPVAAQP
jgi:hypothetical protein